MTTLEVILPVAVGCLGNIITITYAYVMKKFTKKNRDDIIKNFETLNENNQKILESVSNSGLTQRNEINEPYGLMNDLPSLPSSEPDTHRSIHLNDNYKLQIRPKK